MASICIYCNFLKFFYSYPIWIFEIEQSFACETSLYFQPRNFSFLIGVSSLCIFSVILENRVHVILGFINETLACISMDHLIFLLIEAFELVDLFLYIIC